MRPNHVRIRLLLIPLLLVALFAHGEDKKPALPVKDFKNATAFKVLRAIDGDAIEIEQDGKPVKVRLIGVDTPEPSTRRSQSRRSGRRAGSCKNGRRPVYLRRRCESTPTVLPAFLGR